MDGPHSLLAHLSSVGAVRPYPEGTPSGPTHPFPQAAGRALGKQQSVEWLFGNCSC